jgi:hypothetical protein
VSPPPLLVFQPRSPPPSSPFSCSEGRSPVPTAISAPSAPRWQIQFDPVPNSRSTTLGVVPCSGCAPPRHQGPIHWSSPERPLHRACSPLPKSLSWSSDIIGIDLRVTGSAPLAPVATRFGHPAAGSALPILSPPPPAMSKAKSGSSGGGADSGASLPPFAVATELRATDGLLLPPPPFGGQGAACCR